MPMPRAARKKSSDSMYHVMSRSISEIDLFLSDDDKDHYLKLLSKRIKKYHCRVYSYCLMSNHVHLFIDPQGFDISKLMHSLNTAYVCYFNKKYKRHGHLFQGRFTSRIVTGRLQGARLSAYIHNNPSDIPGYKEREESYPYSSYAIITGIRKDIYDLIDREYVLSIFCEGEIVTGDQYRSYVERMKDASDEMAKQDGAESSENVYRRESPILIRNMDIKQVLEKIGSMLSMPVEVMMRTKWRRDCSKIRAFVTYILRTLCGQTYSQICDYVGSMSVSGISSLTDTGYRLVCGENKFKQIFMTLIS
jgi:REP element-mobilizing transposase RayT